jgi:hypothetical protein
MARLIALGREIAAPSVVYPPIAWAALRTAYATLFRSSMEFLSGGALLRGSHKGKPRHADIRLTEFLPHVQPPAPGTELKRRFNAADKLAAHLSVGRTKRHRSRREWGDLGDRRLVLRTLRRTFEGVPKLETEFPNTFTELFVGRTA